MLEICLTFTPRKAKIMLLSPNMRPFCWRHRGSIADRSAGWITISLLLSAGRLPARVHNGYKCLTALKWFHQAGSIEITLAWLSTIGMSRKCFRRVASRSWFQSTAQSTPINLNWGNLLAYDWVGWPTCKLALMESRSFAKLKLWNGKEVETKRVLLQDLQKWIEFRRLLNFFFWNFLESSPLYSMNPLGIYKHFVTLRIVLGLCKCLGISKNFQERVDLIQPICPTCRMEITGRATGMEEVQNNICLFPTSTFLA